MEALGTSKHRPPPRYDFRSSPAYFKMDAQRRLDGIHQKTSKHGQTYTRKHSPPVVDNTLTPLVSCEMSAAVFTTSTPATSFMEISRECATILKPVLLSY